VERRLQQRPRPGAAPSHHKRAVNPKKCFAWHMLASPLPCS
jgi:hypothetical protein